MVFLMLKEAESGVESGIITKYIERYYYEKLDKREKNRGHTSDNFKKKSLMNRLLEQRLYLN